MPKICRTVITWVEEEVLEPIDQWVTQSQQVCQQYPWWDPRGWVCWLVTWLVRITVWITRRILVPISTVVCYFISFVIGGILLPFAAAIGPRAYDWVRVWFLNGAFIETGDKVKSTSQPGKYDYHFTCNCPNGSTHPIVITIEENDALALELAKAECKKKC